MKRLFQYLLLLFLINSCDPGYLAYVRNYSDIPIMITIELNSDFSMSLGDTLKSINSIIEISANPNKNVFDTLIITDIISERTIRFSVGKESTTLIGSPYYGFNKVLLQNKLRSDTIIVDGSGENISTYLDNGILQIKKKLYRYAYIIDIKK